MDHITLEDFKAINPEAHTKALTIVGECGCPEEGDVVTPDQFIIYPHPEGFHSLVWEDYGPFNPVPSWIWDVGAQEWVMNDGDDYERYCALEDARKA